MSHETLPPSVLSKATPGPAPGGQGRGLFASADIQTGEDVLRIQSPFVAVLDTQRLDDTCSGCFGKRKLETNNQGSLKACTGCQTVKYCDRTCQAKDWKFAHSLECSIFQKLYPRILPINARALLRMVLRSERKKYNLQETDLFLQLETHVQEIRAENPSQWDRIAVSSKAVKAYSSTEMKEEMISAFGAKLDVNSFNLTNALYDRLGLYLHPYAALINHSCDFNSTVAFDGPDLYIKAIRPIPQNEQISISYIDTTNPRKRRQTELRERYYFTCHCSKCQTEPDPPSPLPQPLEQTVHVILTSSSTDPSQIESAMQELKSASWPITTQPLVSLRDELIATLLTAGRFESAFAQAAIRYRRVDPVVYGYEAHPLRHVHAWALTKIGIHLSQEMGVGGIPGDTVNLEGFNLNFGLLVWSLLSGLVARREAGGADSCLAPGFRKMVAEAFGEVHQAFLGGGVDPRRMGEEIRGEWGKVDEMVRLMLEEGA